ncbi:uncharacterized protein STEHIDRAFT_152955 [Stereum hirsutum FP-91666 SS1]|uniref:uncharacterized protein n=1 Tax=Stereum hirsutum (strain FP-91666) TaxID=721885 RepID=UPI0004409F5A|nr:uncharacterized protein STEHIDRAFT_152955 [Stereum hirsutum FP-91666 SS1]EIM91309.1 hypothetical protein STEHIDRAFT_152955 [Stereum hirsutum FP-91666 SS1]
MSYPYGQRNQHRSQRHENQLYPFNTPRTRTDSRGYPSDAAQVRVKRTFPGPYEPSPLNLDGFNPWRDRTPRYEDSHTVPSQPTNGYRTSGAGTVETISTTRRMKTRPRSNSLGGSVGSVMSSSGISLPSGMFAMDPGDFSSARTGRSSGPSEVLPDYHRYTKDPPSRAEAVQYAAQQTQPSKPKETRRERSASNATPSVARSRTVSTATYGSYHTSHSQFDHVPRVQQAHPSPVSTGEPTVVYVSSTHKHHRSQSSRTMSSESHRNPSSDSQQTLVASRGNQSTTSLVSSPLSRDVTKTNADPSAFLHRRVAKKSQLDKPPPRPEPVAPQPPSKVKVAAPPRLEWHTCGEHSGLWDRLRGSHHRCTRLPVQTYPPIVFKSRDMENVEYRDEKGDTKPLTHGFFVHNFRKSQLKHATRLPFQDRGFDGGEKLLKLHFLWPGYKPLTSQLHPMQGQMALSSLANFVQDMVKRWFSKIEKDERVWTNDPEWAQWRIANLPDLKGITWRDLIVTALEHRGDNDWQVMWVVKIPEWEKK